MQYTDQQLDIIHSTDSIKVNAVAGSGKTSTILAYAKQRPQAKILYLAFNRSVKLEAQNRLKHQNTTNVQVETAHSLAYKYTNPGKRKNIQLEYKPFEVCEILKIRKNIANNTHLTLAAHVIKFANLFCNSVAKKVSELNYINSIQSEEYKVFLSDNYEMLLHYTRLFLSKMHYREIAITHDFYLKEFQLSEPHLPFTHILFDEAQDASPAMLDVILKQNTTNVFIGDEHQQIYSWRYAQNALQSIPYSSKHLSTSFRFNHEIAHLAQSVIGLKSIIGKASPFSITGTSKQNPIQRKICIARSNNSLLTKAIDLVLQQKQRTKIYFEGELNSYTFSNEGTSIYDIFNLYNYEKIYIKDPLIASMPSFDHLKTYAENTSDNSLKSLLNLVEKYGKNIPEYISKVKNCCVSKDHKNEADMVFSTVHKSKGLEYDEVFLLDDFISEQNIYDLKPSIQLKETPASAIIEEINLLYVALTRTKQKLHIPARFLPSSFYIQNMKTITTQCNFQQKQQSLKTGSGQWSKTEEVELKQLFLSGKTMKEIAHLLGRSASSINSKIKKLGLWD